MEAQNGCPSSSSEHHSPKGNLAKLMFNYSTTVFSHDRGHKTYSSININVVYRAKRLTKFELKPENCDKVNNLRSNSTDSQ